MIGCESKKCNKVNITRLCTVDSSHTQKYLWGCTIHACVEKEKEKKKIMTLQRQADKE
jgi:hypothetical protein